MSRHLDQFSPVSVVRISQSYFPTSWIEGDSSTDLGPTVSGTAAYAAVQQRVNNMSFSMPPNDVFAL